MAYFENSKDLKGKDKVLFDQRQEAVFSKELATLDHKVPLTCDLEIIKVQEPDSQNLFKIFQDLEFWKLAEEFSAKQAAKTAKICELKTKTDIASVIKRILKRGRVSFMQEVGEGDGLFGERSFFLSLGEEKVFSCRESNISLLKEVFEHEDVIKVTYNFKEILKGSSGHSIMFRGQVFDVMLAGYLLGPMQSFYSLNNLSWTYLKESIAEDLGCAAQVDAVDRLYSPLGEDLEKKSLTALLWDVELPLTYVLFEMESNGVSLDEKLLKKLSNECTQKIDELTATLYSMAEEEFNLNSPKQLSHVLFEKLKLPVIKRTKTGFSTNEAVLTALAEQHAFPALILEYRQLAKLKSTYIDALPKLIDSKTGRIHAQFHQTGTETGRLSSSRPNLQNIPIRTALGRQIRKAFITAASDLVLIAADYSQIELRILAHLSKDKELLKAFKQGEDIHTFTASLIFDAQESNVTKQMRDRAKRVNFGIIYGISAFGLSNDLKVTQGEAQDFIDRYFARYPSVKKFMDDEIRRCEEMGYVKTILNRRRYIPEIKSQNNGVRQFAQRQAINTPVQGAAADLIKLAMINIQEEIKAKKLKSKMISTVHDELIFEVPSSEKSIMIDLIRYQMEHAVELAVPVEVSVKVGKNWLEMEAV